MRKWKESFLWLKLTKKKKTCEVCFSEKEKVMLMPQIKFSFTMGCTNLKLPALQDHQKSGHKQALK